MQDDFDAELHSMTLLNDDELWQAAQTILPSDAAAHLESLHDKRQREGWTEIEAQTAADLVRQYERYMLVRAQAIALLKQRGHDVLRLLHAA